MICTVWRESWKYTHFILVSTWTFSLTIRARSHSSKAADRASQKLQRAFCGKTRWKFVLLPLLLFWTFSLSDKRFLRQNHWCRGGQGRSWQRNCHLSSSLAQISFLLPTEDKGLVQACCNYKKLLRIGKCRSFPKGEFAELQPRHPREAVEAAPLEKLVQRAILCW